MTNNPSMPCDDITELLPVVYRGAVEFLKRCSAAGLKVKITQTYRSSAYQDILYAQGRTAPGDIITNCKGGASPHNFRYAFDICQNISGKAYDESKIFTLDGKPVDFFQYCGRIWQDMGGEWGGSWASFPDKPHMQYGAGFTDAQIRAGAKIPDIAVMPWEKVTVNSQGNASSLQPTKEEEQVTQQQFDAMMEVYKKEQISLPASDWKNDEFNKAIRLGITDGTNPKGFATREQVSVMAERLYELLSAK